MPNALDLAYKSPPKGIYHKWANQQPSVQPHLPPSDSPRLVQTRHDIFVRQKRNRGRRHRPHHVGPHARVKRPPPLLLEYRLERPDHAPVLELNLLWLLAPGRDSHALQELFSRHRPALDLQSRPDHLAKLVSVIPLSDEALTEDMLHCSQLSWIWWMPRGCQASAPPAAPDPVQPTRGPCR